MEQENIQTSGTSKLPILKQVEQIVEGSSTPHIPGPVIADEKIQKKNDVKARSMLLMALPNEHLMTLNQYKDAKRNRFEVAIGTVKYEGEEVLSEDWHFIRECRVPRNQENITKNQETTRRIVNVKDTSSKAMVSIDGAGFDWSYMV
nr:hypothetical protein [Tanacetum cinerariifolium]